MENELWKCSRRKCGFIGPKSSWEEKPHPDFDNVTQLICPRCGCDSFYKAKPGEVSRPTVVCLCGSSKWPETHMEVMMRETLAGRIVVPMGLYGHADFPAGARHLTNDGDEATEVKQLLDRLHFAKIDLADEILVVNVGGYYGSSTKREIEYATAKKKKVRFLETPAV